MSLGSLYDHLHHGSFVLFKRKPPRLDWNARMKIAIGVAHALKFLHNDANPRFTYGVMRPADVQLGYGFHAKLCNFGMAEEVPSGDRSRTRFEMDVYDFGLFVVEIVTGKKPKDWRRGHGEYIEEWLFPKLTKKKKLIRLVDQKMEGHFPHEYVLKRLFELLKRCLNIRGELRPDMRSVVRALDHFTSETSAWPWEFSVETDDYTENYPHPQIFFYRELSEATDAFSRQCCIHTGLFGSIYKGFLYTHEVMIMEQTSMRPPQKQHLTDIILTHFSHHNVANLIGYCFEEDKRLLVYEFMQMGTLFDNLYDETRVLDWNTRLRVATGVAQGLNYLHSQKGIMCRHISSSTIYLADEFQPKICGLEVASYGNQEVDELEGSVRIMCHRAYIAPECQRLGVFTYKSDVYGFGVVLLEILIGQRALDQNCRDMLIESKNFMEFADPKLQGQFPKEMFEKAMLVACMCMDGQPDSRPDMSVVVRALNCLTSAGADWPVEFREEVGEPSSSTTRMNSIRTQTIETIVAEAISRVEKASCASIERIEKVACGALESIIDYLEPIPELEEVVRGQ